MRRYVKDVLLRHPDKLLSTVLWLVAVHSITIGLALITQPAVLMELAGFSSECERFFPTQGGVFHLLMAVAYLMGALNITKYHCFIVFAIFVKAVATFFLTIYCFAVEFKWVILLSGIGDCMMGFIIFAALQYYLHYQTKHNSDRRIK